VDALLLTLHSPALGTTPFSETHAQDHLGKATPDSGGNSKAQSAHITIDLACWSRSDDRWWFQVASADARPNITSELTPLALVQTQEDGVQKMAKLPEQVGVGSELDPDTEKMGKAIIFNRCRRRRFKSTATIANLPIGTPPTTTAWNRRRASRVQVDVRRRDSPVDHRQRALCVGRSSRRAVPLHKQRFLVLIQLGSSLLASPLLSPSVLAAR
jgi:hypothetical protein